MQKNVDYTSMKEKKKKEDLKIDQTRLSNVLRMFKEEAIVYLIMVIIFACLAGYSYGKLYDCETKTSASCSFYTCATKDTKCGNFPFYFDSKGNKVCIFGNN